METDYAQEASSPETSQPCYGTAISLELRAAIAEALSLGYVIEIKGGSFKQLIPAMDVADSLPDNERAEVAARVQHMLGRSYHVWPK